MAALPFLITAATAVYVALFPPDEGRKSPKALSSSFGLISNESTILSNQFLIGVGVGVSLSLFSSYEVRRRRLWQRFRLNFLSWLNDMELTLTESDEKDGTPLLKKLRKPIQILQLKGTPIPRKSKLESNYDCINGSHLELVSPDWVPSSNLYCDVVTLPPETELISKSAEGVEFYYVIKGDGRYIDHNDENHQISAGYGFIVDPERHRGFVVGGSKNGLVLLRATDVAGSRKSNHETKLRQSALSSTVAYIRAGAERIYKFIEKQTSS